MGDEKGPQNPLALSCPRTSFTNNLNALGPLMQQRRVDGRLFESIDIVLAKLTLM